MADDFKELLIKLKLSTENWQTIVTKIKAEVKEIQDRSKKDSEEVLRATRTQQEQAKVGILEQKQSQETIKTKYLENLNVQKEQTAEIQKQIQLARLQAVT